MTLVVEFLELAGYVAIAYGIFKLLTKSAPLTETELTMAEIQDGSLIPLTVELDNNTFFCYNMLTKEFVCQGNDLNEIMKKFTERFPDTMLSIYNDNSTAVKILNEQRRSQLENRNRI
jgi:hypothetical protein